MKLTQFEQSGFIIESDSGFKLALDIASKTPIEKLTEVEADAFLISHIHGDHFSLPHIHALKPKAVFLNTECKETLGEEALSFSLNIIRDGDTVTIGDMQVQIFNVDHGPNVTSPLAENFGFLITVDSTTFYFAGDMFYESGIDVTNLEVDYALIPVGTFYTFGPQEAYNFTKKFKKIGEIIPMHYDKTPETRGKFLMLTGV